ncbi:MAG: histidine--tRNA ligase [Lachnospiraceae bacterium]|nr:histidine--tRNA ligase [Lachnospiraceae bacterium]
MAVLTRKVKGAEDILPRDSYKWQFVEDIMRKEAECHGYKEIRTPVFEHTVLFNRSVGETTDVVQKEMYTFDTKGGESITLRPEGTAGAARAYLEHALYNDGLPVKVYYMLTCYRYEKAQAGRQREFHQFGMEAYGSADARADAEMICAASSIFERLGLKEKIKLEINSIGCPTCRKKYSDALKTYFGEHKESLCDTCLSRLDRNPMRILDCKSEICKGIAQNAPTVLDYICEDCAAHFEQVKGYLDCAGIEYTVNPTIVRGLDYYTRTVFEFVTDCIGAQGTVCGGGRYDGLIEELGGQPTPSLGFAMGLERLLMVLRANGTELPGEPVCDIYIAALGDAANKKAFTLIQELRSASFRADGDLVGRGLRAQMKYANKIGAKYSVVIGDDDLSANKAMLKNMESGEQTEMPLDGGFLEKFISLYVENEQKRMIAES